MNDSNENEEEGELVWTAVEGAQLIYSDGSTNPPPEFPLVDENRKRIPPAIIFAGLFFASFVMLLSIGLGAWTIKLRESRVVRAAQPEFLCLLCLGTFVMASCVIPMSLQEPIPQKGLDVACMADMWLFMIGFAVSFSALMAKMQRINAIFSIGNFKRVVVKPLDVMKPFFVLITANVVVLTSWTVIAPLTYTRVITSTDQLGRTVESYGTCSQVNGATKVLPFVGLLVMLNLFCIFFANVQAYRARNIRMEYSESRYIAISMASILQAFVLGIPVMAAASANPEALFLLKSALVTLVCLATLVPMFLPKILSDKDFPEVPSSRRPSGLKLHQRTVLRYGGHQSGMNILTREKPEQAKQAAARNGRIARHQMGCGSFPCVSSEDKRSSKVSSEHIETDGSTSRTTGLKHWVDIRLGRAGSGSGVSVHSSAPTILTTLNGHVLASSFSSQLQNGNVNTSMNQVSVVVQD